LHLPWVGKGVNHDNFSPSRGRCFLRMVRFFSEVRARKPRATATSEVRRLRLNAGESVALCRTRVCRPPAVWSPLGLADASLSKLDVSSPSCSVDLVRVLRACTAENRGVCARIHPVHNSYAAAPFRRQSKSGTNNEPFFRHAASATGLRIETRLWRRWTVRVRRYSASTPGRRRGRVLSTRCCVARNR
jgi:hypothetical protein